MVSPPESLDLSKQSLTDSEKIVSMLLNALGKNVGISVGKKDGIISVTVLDEDPKRAAAMANAYDEELDRLVVRLNF